MKISGVYKITNNITGDFYVGSSNNVKKRWYNHKSLSQWKRHPGMKLYQAFINYGLDNFTFEIIEKTDNLKEREQYWIEQLKPSYNNLWAKGQNTERYKQCHKAYRQAHRDKESARMKDYNNRLCFYEGETLTLNALRKRFRQQGMPHPILEAKKYLIVK